MKGTAFMSRSYKKYPIHSDSNAFGKRIASRRLRHAIQRILRNRNVISESVLMPLKDEVFDMYFSQGDSKCHFDPIEWPEGLRK